MSMTVRQLLAPSALMNKIKPQMVTYRAAYEGGPNFKNSVLVKRPSEDAALFRDKLLNVAALPICKAIVDEIVDTVYETEPQRHPAFLNKVSIPVAEPAWWAAFEEDADLNGNSFTACMETIACMAGIEGWAWVFVDLPETASKNNRPYLSYCSAEHVIDWKIATEYGKDFIEYLKVIEYEDMDHSIIKVWYAGDAVNPTYCERYWVTDKELNDQDQLINPIESYTLPLGMPIPAVQVIGRPDQRRSDLGVSDLTEAADVQREMLKLEAEAYDSIRFSKPMIRAAAGIRIPAGGGGIIRGDKDQVEVFQIPTQDIQAIREQQDSLIVRLDGFLGRGSIRFQATQQVQSGISIVEERRALHRKASARARQMQAAEMVIADLVCLWMGLYWAGDIDYATDYEDKDTQFRMALLQTAQALSATNPVVQEIIDRESDQDDCSTDEAADYLAKIGVANTSQPVFASTDEKKFVVDKISELEGNIYGGEIQDKGVTTNDPIARQLVMLGVGR